LVDCLPSSWIYRLDIHCCAGEDFRLGKMAMEKLSVVASIIAVVTFLWGISKWVVHKLKPKRTDHPPAEVKKSLEMPPQANDPAIREAMRQLHVQIHGKAPTRDEIDEMLATSLITSGIDQITALDLAEFEEMQKAEQSNPCDSSPAQRVRDT